MLIARTRLEGSRALCDGFEGLGPTCEGRRSPSRRTLVVPWVCTAMCPASVHGCSYPRWTLPLPMSMPRAWLCRSVRLARRLPRCSRPGSKTQFNASGYPFRLAVVLVCRVIAVCVLPVRLLMPLVALLVS